MEIAVEADTFGACPQVKVRVEVVLRGFGSGGLGGGAEEFEDPRFDHGYRGHSMSQSVVSCGRWAAGHESPGMNP